MKNRKIEWLPVFAAAGTLALMGFLVVFVNIPWDWNMFMDDVAYNAWMPKVEHPWQAFLQEVSAYWQLGRFYPAKYAANLLKWKYLPNDPFVFRCFNLGVYLVAVSSIAWASLRAARVEKGRSFSFAMMFLIGASVLHKPLLEIISLNPLGETWVFLFFSLGSLCLFSENPFLRYGATRFFFVLVALSKEPAALVYFASAAFYLALALGQREKRKSMLIQAALDLVIFCAFLAMASYAMSQGSFTKGAYFSSTPWLLYAKNFTYKTARYALWTSPFLVLFAFGLTHLKRALLPRGAALPHVAFFLIFGGAYSVFMSIQGIVAYQEVPASAAFLGLFGILTGILLKIMPEVSTRKIGVLVALFATSYFISTSRWERFVLGIVEPKRAVTNLLVTGQEMTILVPVGELHGHLLTMIQELNPKASTFDLDENLALNARKFKGTVYVFEFPTYMGPLGHSLQQVEALVGGWNSVVDARSYRIYRAAQDFSAN